MLAATNRPDQLDAALLRPGRLDRAIYVRLPDEATRKAIFVKRLSKMAVRDVGYSLIYPLFQVNVEDLVRDTKGYSGAEIVALCANAALTAMRENVNATEVRAEHFNAAKKLVVARTPTSLLDIYEKFNQGLS